MNSISKLLAICFLAVLLSGCGSEEAEQTREEVIKQVNATGILTDKQAETLGNSKVLSLRLNGLTEITDEQAKSLSRAKKNLTLDGLTSITDKQAESLSKVEWLYISEDLEPLIGKYQNQ